MAMDISGVSCPLPVGATADAVRTGGTVVLGYGVSNRPLVQLLLRLGASVTVYDQKPVEELGEDAAAAKRAGVRFVQQLTALDPSNVRVVFRSPGFRPDLPFLTAARRCGARVTSEMEWFLELTPATVIGVTGSDGKTTTSTLTAKLLAAAVGEQHVYLGGNIGRPLLPLATAMTDRDFAVVELSSFQLMDMQHAPRRAAITNVTPNHLNWHADMTEYADAKTRIFQGTGCDTLVLNRENALTLAMAQHATGVKTVLFSSKRTCWEDIVQDMTHADAVCVQEGVLTYCEATGNRTPLVRVQDILLPGVHNLENYMCAVALTYPYIKAVHVEAIARSFGGVEHRLELVRTRGGVKFYNSSIDSSPTRTAAALSTMPQGRTVVICGGYDKNIDFAPLAKALARTAKAIVLTGATADKIQAALHACPEAARVPVRTQAAFDAAVQLAASLAEPGDVVLLSPACASFDAFPNFAVRGDTFRRIVHALDES